VLDVMCTPMFVAPGDVPASTTYDSAAQPVLGAVHQTVTALAFAVYVTPVGGPGGEIQGGGDGGAGGRTVPLISSDGALSP
jgi:hypothetical protein